VKMDDPNITMEEYIRLEEEKARRCGKVYNWEISMYGKIRPRWQSQALLLATKTWRGSKGYDDGFGNQGMRLKTKDAPKDLEASLPH
ncbi:hypothetical protein Tco_0906233, partial [Tanacetum coccineum]